MGTRMDEFSDQVNVKLFSLFSKGRARHYTYQKLFLWNIFFVTDQYARPCDGLQRFPYADIRIVFAVFVKIRWIIVNLLSFLVETEMRPVVKPFRFIIIDL